MDQQGWTNSDRYLGGVEALDCGEVLGGGGGGGGEETCRRPNGLASGSGSGGNLSVGSGVIEDAHLGGSCSPFPREEMKSNLSFG